jgi:hypothetical protein
VDARFLTSARQASEQASAAGAVARDRSGRSATRRTPCL